MKTPNIQLLRDLVMVKAMPLELSKTKLGIIVPGDMDKMSPKKAVVVAAGPGTYNKKGEFVKAPCEAGDVILYMERDLIPVKLEGEEYLIIPASEVLLKLPKDQSPNSAEVVEEALEVAVAKKDITQKLITKLGAMGLQQLEDMSGPVDFYVADDGTEMTPAARSFIVTEESLSSPFTPPEGTVAFAMWQVAERVPGVNTGEFVARLAFLDKLGKKAE